MYTTYDIKQIVCPVCGRGSTEFVIHTDYTVEGYDALWERLKCQR